MSEFPECRVCGAPSAVICSSCRSAAYCRKQHQEEDWPRHEKDCRACKVVSSTTGSFVVATRDINEGEVIAADLPLVVGPSTVVAVPPSCLGCFFVLTPRQNDAKCPRCRWPVCNVNCPGLKDPVFHGAECELLTAIESSLINHQFESILFLRCLLLQKSSPRKWHMLFQLAKRARAISQRSVKLDSEIFFEENILKPLVSTAPHLIPHCSMERMKDIYSVLDAFGLPLRMATSGLLLTVSPMASQMEHSCVPNTRLFFEALTTWKNPREKLPESRIIMRAVKNIRKAQHLTTYFLSSPLMNTFSRQKSLLMLRNERCECPRCVDPTELDTNFSTLKCSTGTCEGWVVPVEPLREDTQWKCKGRCVTEYGPEFSSKVLSDCLTIVQKLRDQKNSPTVIELEDIVTHLESLLHPRHVLCVEVKNRLMKAYSEYKNDGSWDVKPLTDADLERKGGLCVAVLDVLLKPFMREPTNIIIQECLSHLILVRMEMLERKVSSGEWNSTRVDVAKRQCCQLFLLSQQIAYGSASSFELQSQDQIFNTVKSALPKMRMHLW